MNIQTIINPEGNLKSATFALGADLIKPYGKIIIPKNDPLTSAVPIAYHGFLMSPKIFRTDLVHDENNGTIVSFNALSPDPKFAWSDSDLGKIKDSISAYFEKNATAIDLAKLEDIPSMSPFDPNEADEEKLVTVFHKVVGKRVQSHGGSYELTDDMTAVPQKSGGIFNKKDTGRFLVTAAIAPFGACGGCGLFQLTFGKKTVDAINEELTSINSPYILKEIIKDKKMGVKGSVLIKRLGL